MKPWVKVSIGLVFGVIVGLVFGRQIEILRLIGKAFIDLLRMLVGLIIFSSLISGMCHISSPKALGRIGLRTLSFYVVTTIAAIVFGVIVVHLIRPGVSLNLPIPLEADLSDHGMSLIGFLFSIVPSNPFQAFASGNILQVIVFAVFFALAISMCGEKGKPVLVVIESISEVMSHLTHIIMKLAPYGVFALMASAVGEIGAKVILPLIKVIICIGLGCFLQIAIVFCLSIKYLTGYKIAPFFKGMKDAVVVAFSTSSSAATLPVSLECAKEHLGVSPDISGFVMSLGSTINMNGTAIGQAVSAIFIAQAYGIEVTWVNMVVLVITSLFSAIGTAGIPGSGLVMLSIVLSSMGLPLEGVALVAGIDRLRDMLATVVNILGDAVATLYVAKEENKIDIEVYHRSTWIN